MSHLGLGVWTTLMSDDLAPLRDAAAAIDARDVAAIAGLRRLHRPELVAAALDLAAARRKATTKLPAQATDLVADAAGVEQASSADVAAHKAERYRALLSPGEQVIDLCCGIGGDARALRDAGLRVLAIDRDPVRAWMARRHANCPTACADVMRLALRDMPFHLDPARRMGGHDSGIGGRQRVFRFAQYQPGPAFIGDLLRTCPDGGIKLSPGVDLVELESYGLDGEIEFISEAGRLVQAMLWTGRLRRTSRSATMLGRGDRLTIHGMPKSPPIGAMRRYLFTVDPSVERAELLGTLCAALDVEAVHARLGLLTADRLIDSPWLTPFELLAELPWRPRKVKRWLAAHDAGLVEVKTRGKAVDPDRVQADLRGTGATPYTVFVLRWDQPVVALITRRLASPAVRT